MKHWVRVRQALLLSLVLRESALLDSTGGLKAEMFSSELLGRCFGGTGQFCRQRRYLRIIRRS